MCARNPMGKRDIVPDYIGRRKLACKKKKIASARSRSFPVWLIRICKIEIDWRMEITEYKFIKDLRKNLGIFWLIY